MFMHTIVCIHDYNHHEGEVSYEGVLREKSKLCMVHALILLFKRERLESQSRILVHQPSNQPICLAKTRNQISDLTIFIPLQTGYTILNVIEKVFKVILVN